MIRTWYPPVAAGRGRCAAGTSWWPVTELEAGDRLTEHDLPDEYALLVQDDAVVGVEHDGQAPASVSEPAFVVVPAGTSTVHAASSTTVTRVFTARCVDVGPCWSVPKQPGITSTVLGEFPLVAVLHVSDPLASSHEVRLADLRTRQILITPRADNPHLESQLQAEITRAGIPRTHIEEVGRYDELAVHVATRGHVGLHPGPFVLTNPLPTVVFRPIADASDPVRICAISHAESHTASIPPLIASLRSIVDSHVIDDKLT